MNCERNVNSILPTQLPHKFSYIVAILIHNHFESPIMYTIVTLFIVLENLTAFHIKDMDDLSFD
jgi:hypothetical protein